MCEFIVRVEGMPWPKISATYYHAQFGIPDKGRAIKESVVFWMLLKLTTRMFYLSLVVEPGVRGS